jgi:hypothetical protein
MDILVNDLTRRGYHYRLCSHWSGLRYHVNKPKNPSRTRYSISGLVLLSHTFSLSFCQSNHWLRTNHSDGIQSRSKLQGSCLTFSPFKLRRDKFNSQIDIILRLCRLNFAIMATELTVQSERAFQKQPHIFLNSKSKAKSKRVGKGGRRWYKDVGLGFRTPKTAIEGSYIGMGELPK